MCPTLDQRGYGRSGTSCDKGAAEFNGIAPAAILTKTYYFAGSQLVAMREITTTGAAGTLYYMHQDHLGSTNLTTNSSGAVVSRQLFYPYGEVRWSTGTTPTTIGYTGQRRDMGLGSLMFYNARYYSPLLSRFVSADAIVPDGDKVSIVPLTVYFHEVIFLVRLNAENNFILKRGFWFQLDQNERQDAKISKGPSNPQVLNRYSYVLNNPLAYIDPTGHEYRCSADFSACYGSRVINLSSHAILIKGDFLRADGQVERDVIFILNPGVGSDEIGFLDVDEILPYEDSIDGHGNGETIRLTDFDTVFIEDDYQTGEATLVGGIFRSYNWEKAAYDSDTRPSYNNPPQGVNLFSNGTMFVALNLFDLIVTAHKVVPALPEVQRITENLPWQ